MISSALYIVRVCIWPELDVYVKIRIVLRMLGMSDYGFGIIYLITSPSKKCYVGQTTTKNFWKRMGDHRRGTESCTALRRAVKKYGWENMRVEILGRTRNLDKLNNYERKFIKLYKSFGKMGYNLLSGGRKNYRVSDQTKFRMCQTWKNRSEKAKKQHSDRIKMAWKRRSEASKEYHRRRVSETMKKRRQNMTEEEKALHAAVRSKKVKGRKIGDSEWVNYLSMHDAIRKIKSQGGPLLRTGNISRICQRKRISTGGYEFRYI